MTTFSFLGIISVSAATIPEGYEIAEQVTIDFNTEGKGWSDTNEKSSLDNLKQVTDPDDSANKYMTLYTNNGDGYNMEIASGSDSSTAFTMKPSTKYNITFKYKALDSNQGSLTLYYGSVSEYVSSKPKFGPVKTWAASSANDGTWKTASFDFTTTDSMTYASYKGSGSTAICDNLYLVARDGINNWAIDDIIITSYKPATPKNQITYINFNNDGKGWSDKTNASYVSQVTDPNNSANKYLTLGTPNGDGYNIELASGSNSTSAYILEPSTQYTITFKYKPLDSIDSNLALYIGSISAYKSSNPKYGPLKEWYATSASDGEWHTATYSFTTTASMTYASYKGSGSTAVCDNLYLVARGNKNTWAIDDVEIKKHVAGATGDTYVDGIKPDSGSGDNNTGDDNTGDEEQEKMKYEILDFTHEPYKTYAEPGKHSGVWYCSLRWSTATDNGNSCIRYKYAYDIAENAPSTSGNRGVNAMGTNGGTPAAMNLVPTATPKVPITVQMGKSYKITFKYKVLNIEPNSYVQFNIMRGKYNSGWTATKAIGDSGATNSDRYIMVVEYGPNDDWVEASYTFTANYSTETDFDKMQIGGMGYGEALIDDIVVQEIDASEVAPPNNDSANYIYDVSGSTSTITSYKAKAVDLTITSQIGRRQLVEIGEYAFLYNRFTKNIVIENGPTTIGRYAFEYAKVLETISIPKSVTTIGKGAFYGIKTMKAFTVAADNPNFASVDGVLYTKDMKTLLYYPAAKDATTFTVPSTVTTIAEGAFLNATKLKTVVLPDGVTTIERRAFMNCTALENINIPSSITSIGSSTFRSCSKLSANNITVSEDVTLGENPFADSLLAKYGNIDNDDDVVDLKDATALVRNLAGWKNSKFDSLKAESADINDDGHVDLLDAVILQRHLAGWQGYENLPYTGETDYTYAEYSSDSTIPELVVNLTEKNSNKVVSNRDIAYDENKEDVIIILITGQSNSGTNGYSQEYGYKYTTQYNGVTHPDWEITAEPTRPEPNTVFFGATVTKLDSSTDVYTKTDPSKGTSTMGGYSPAMGKALHDATGAKIVFVQASKGAVGMHEWTPEPEKYECPCGENGGGVLYSQAIANFTKTYQALEDDYNIIATAYVYNQGEHEEYKPYVTNAATVHDDEGYYKALLEMHNGFLSECEIDCGGVFLPRSWYNRYTESEPGLTDIEQNSRRPSIARAAQYAAAQKVDRFFIFSNVAEEICKAGPLKPDPTNSIHYSQGAYNAIGAQNADSVAKYFGFTEASEFEGIRVFNLKGVELCAFDKDGKLVSGSDVIDFSSDNSKLYIRIDPTGTMYTLDYSSDFVDEYGYVTSVNGQTSFRIVINTPVK